jgi:mono/diheme cytochrome c family protein
VPAATTLRARWNTLWPQGLAVADADIPDRDVTAALPEAATREHDPLRPRALARWLAPDLEALTAGLAGMLETAPARRVVAHPQADAALARLAARGGLDTAFGPALVDAWIAESEGRRVTVLPRVAAAHGRPASPGLVKPGLVRPDWVKPARVKPDLVKSGSVKSGAASAATPPSGTITPARRAYARHCAACHDTPLAHPPNFLAGDAARVEAQLTACAPPILARLTAARRPHGDLVAMPPGIVGLKPDLRDLAAWTASADYAALVADAQQRLGKRAPEGVCAPGYRDAR